MAPTADSAWLWRGFAAGLLLALAALLLGGVRSGTDRVAPVICAAYLPVTAGTDCRQPLPPPMAQPAAIDALPDLTLSEAAARWGVKSNNAIKARALALGVVLRRETPTRTVWPAADVPLGDRLAEHLKRPGAKLSDFPEALPSVPAPTASSATSEARPIAPADGGRQSRKRSGALSLTAAGAGSDGLLALAQLAAAMTPQPPADPLAVARGLSEAAELGAWLTGAELAQLLGVAAGTVRGWSGGHSPRPGFLLERRKDGAAVWWRVTASAD